MPYYTITNTKSGQSHEVLCSWDELQHLLKLAGVQGPEQHDDEPKSCGCGQEKFS
mgnify:FL=1